MSGRLSEQKCGCALSFSLLYDAASQLCFPKARIALLEGERRSFENVKLDLMRRIKMLEYALRMERLVVCYRRVIHARCLTRDNQVKTIIPAKLARGSAYKTHGITGTDRFF
jgi:hypothetical protein